jgi:hypothetical protein
MAYIGKEPIVGNFQKCDALTASATADYTLQVSSVNVVPESANHMLVSLNGILQAPTTSFTVSGSTLSFASALTSSDSIDFVMLLGNVLDLGVPSDNSTGAAQIKDDLISGTTALASEPADTDEFLVSDAGTLKRIDYSLIKGGGKVLQSVSVLSSALVTASSTDFPEDDTIPQNTEGTEVMTLAITPVSATSKLHIFVNAFGSHTGSTRTGIALFVDSTAGALAFSDSANAGATTMMNSSLNHVVTSASTDARTYKVRMAGMATGTLSFNGQSGARKFGGVASSSIIIMEIEA